MRRWLFAAAIVLGTGLSAAAQTGSAPDADTAPMPSSLVADRVFITPERTLVAEGNVEAFQGDTRISASRITFDRENGKLSIDGPVRIDQGGRITVLATGAEMDTGLQNGLISGARVVMDQQLQLAALQMARVDGRYSQLFKTAVTSCKVCEDGRPPLWQIRARKIIHDQQERQLYFEDAQFRILDVPVFYFPRFRLPDPTLDRARGFLVPSARITSKLGPGVKIPYFFPIGPHRDLTVEPYVSPKTRTLGFRYRQAYRAGRLNIEGAYTRDDLMPGEHRGYLFSDGWFELPHDFRLVFDIEAVSDDSYVNDYGLPDVDRLRSEIKLERIKRDDFFHVGLIHFESLRESDNEETLPTFVADAVWEKRFHPRGIGGELRTGLLFHTHHRRSDEDVIGRDVQRATADFNWRRNWVFGNGLRADWLMGVSADLFRIHQDSNYPGDILRTTPRAALKLAYPMMRTTAAGATHLIEPVVQVGWTDLHGGDVPVDESRFVEFDRGNLLSLSRFPAPDQREHRPTLVYGVNWSRYAPSGWQASATLGQVFRTTADPGFSVSSGLSGTSSDLLVAGQILTDQGLALTGRTLLDGDLGINKAEIRGDWFGDRLGLSSTYLWLGADSIEGREKAQSEFWFDGEYLIHTQWTARAHLRYDITDNQATRAGFGVVYRNECVTVDVSVQRRYTSSTSVVPTTDFGFTIALNGFSIDGNEDRYRRKCS